MRVTFTKHLHAFVFTRLCSVSFLCFAPWRILIIFRRLWSIPAKAPRNFCKYCVYSFSASKDLSYGKNNSGDKYSGLGCFQLSVRSFHERNRFPLLFQHSSLAPEKRSLLSGQVWYPFFSTVRKLRICSRFKCEFLPCRISPGYFMKYTYS